MLQTTRGLGVGWRRGEVPLVVNFSLKQGQVRRYPQFTLVVTTRIEM